MARGATRAGVSGGALVSADRGALLAQIERLHFDEATTLTKSELRVLLEPQPVPMRLHCPECGELHEDVGEWATRVHHTHSCQFCGCTWRPAVVATVGVRFLPGFKNAERCGHKFSADHEACIKPPRHEGDHHDGNVFWNREP